MLSHMPVVIVSCIKTSQPHTILNSCHITLWWMLLLFFEGGARIWGCETHIHIHLHIHLHTHTRIHIGICCQNGAESPAPQAATCQLWAGEANHFPGLPSQGLSPNNLRQHVHWKTVLERWLWGFVCTELFALSTPSPVDAQICVL